MTDQGREKLKYWLVGLFSGGAVGGAIAAFVTKKISDKTMEAEVAKAREEGENRGMNSMAEYAIQQQQHISVKTQTTKDIETDDAPEPSEYGDLSIEDEEAKERSIAHSQYLDMIEKYQGNADMQTHIITEDQYINEMYMQKSSINWYEDDDVFEEGLEVIKDPYLTFGVTSGRELFADTSHRPDPDICYVRNEAKLYDFEINRIHGSYTKMVGGEMSLGEADP